MEANEIMRGTDKGDNQKLFGGVEMSQTREHNVTVRGARFDLFTAKISFSLSATT